MISTIMIKLHSSRLWEFSIISKQALWLSSPRGWEVWCWLCSNTKLVGEKSGAHIALLQNTENAQNWGMPCKIHNRRHHHLARLFAERRPPLLGPAACIRSLGHEKPPALLCIWYQICAHISTAEVLFKWWGQMCVGEVVKRVMSPNVNRWCLMSLTFIWCHWWKLNHACRYIPNCLLADAICISRKKWW